MGLPFLLLYPLPWAPRSEPSTSTPGMVMGQGRAVTVTARPLGERGQLHQVAGAWGGLAVLMAVMRGPASICGANPRGWRSEAQGAQPSSSGSLEPRDRLRLLVCGGGVGPRGQGWGPVGAGRAVPRALSQGDLGESWSGALVECGA